MRKLETMIILATKNSSLIWLILSLFLFARFPEVCMSETVYPINELPMYGGIEKSAKMKMADSIFINAIVKQYGSKDKAFDAYINFGWHYLSKNEFSESIKRFNQAWLIYPENFNVYWGFGAVLLKRKEFDKSVDMINKAFKLNPDNVKLIIDVAQTYTGKAVDGSKSTEEKNMYLTKAITLYERANRLDPNSAMLYSQWAITSFYQGKYRDTWDKIYKAKKLDTNCCIPPEFITELESIMADPYKQAN